MARLLLTLQVFLLMCLPVPQAAYAAVAYGGAFGLDLRLMLGLYVVASSCLFLTAYTLSRVLGVAGIARLRRRLPEWVDRRLNSAVARAPSPRDKKAYPAVFFAGYANLYLAAVVAGLGRMRVVPAMLFGMAGDVLQFSGAVLLAGVLARLLPFPGSNWAALMLAPVVMGLTPAAIRISRFALAYLKRPRSSFLPGPRKGSLPVRVPANEPPRKR